MSLLWKKGEVLNVNRRLATIVGLNEAMVLQQISYWLDEKECGQAHEGRMWIYNTMEQWAQQFPFWSIDTVKRSIAGLQKRGLILVQKLASKTRDQTNYYAIDYEQVALLDRGNLHGSIGATCTDGSSADCTNEIGATCPAVSKTRTTTRTTARTTLQPAMPAAKSANAECLEPTETELQAACRTTWTAYSEAFERRYGQKPVRNQSVNSKVKQFVQRIGHDESPAVAAFYVDRVSDSFVVRKVHDVGLLLSGAEGYRTQWAAGSAMTGTRAQQIDQTQSNYDAAGEAMAILRQRRAGGQT